MRQTLFALAIVTSLLIVPPAYAEEASASPSTSGMRQDRQELRQEMRTEGLQVREENKEKREEQKTVAVAARSQFNLVRASARATILERKYEFISKRFDNIIARFESRITTIESTGKDLDLTEVKSKLDAAKLKLVEAKVDGNVAVEGFKSITASSTKEDFTKLQVLVKTADASFRAVNDSLKIALKQLKPISKPALPAASPAVSNSL